MFRTNFKNNEIILISLESSLYLIRFQSFIFKYLNSVHILSINIKFIPDNLFLTFSEKII